jgi:hypothetical protein
VSARPDREAAVSAGNLVVGVLALCVFVVFAAIGVALWRMK